MSDNITQHESPDTEAPRKSLLEEANGNYLQAGMMFFDRLPLPQSARMILKCLLLLIAISTALCALLWPLIMRYL